MNKHESKYNITASYMDEALLILLEQKEYDFISVKEICNTAGVNRSTFYLHYESIDDLLEETINYASKKFMEKLNQIDNKSDIYNTVLTREKYLKPYLEFIKENKKLYKLMHDKPQLFKINSTTNRLYENLFDVALTRFKVKDEEKEFIFSFYTEGVLGIIKTWLKNDCKEDIDFIINIIERNTFIDKIANE